MAEIGLKVAYLLVVIEGIFNDYAIFSHLMCIDKGIGLLVILVMKLEIRGVGVTSVDFT